MQFYMRKEINTFSYEEVFADNVGGGGGEASFQLVLKKSVPCEVKLWFWSNIITRQVLYFFLIVFILLLQGHPKLRFCPGPNCSVIIHAKEPRAKKVECSVCKSVYW